MTYALRFNCTFSLVINLDIKVSEMVSISGGAKFFGRLAGETGSAPVNLSMTSVPYVGIVPMQAASSNTSSEVLAVQFTSSMISMAVSLDMSSPTCERNT